MKITGGQAIMEALIQEGVDVIFGYPGGAIMPVYDALYDYQNKIRHILVRHEQGAAHAAEGYARISGKVGVCLSTSGPGATNLVTGIADAFMDSVPLVCITGQVTASLVGTSAFQETDIIGVTKPITKWNIQVRKAEELPTALAKGFFVAQDGRPGPVLIDVTKNAQFEKFDFSYKKLSKKENTLSQSQKNSLKTAAKLLNNALRPMIFAGHGVLIAKAEKELLEFVTKGDFPTASTLHGLSSLSNGHRLFVGMLGMHGNYGATTLINKADVILAIGMRFDDRVTGRLSDFAKNAKIIHIDIDPKEINKIVKVKLPINADAKSALKELIKHINKNSRTAWLDEFRQFDEIEHEKVIKKELDSKNDFITMTQTIRSLSEKTKGKAIVVADVGQQQMITARYYKSAAPNNFITSGGLGTLGFGLPASIGAKIASPEKEVIAIIGDGGFQMTIQELATIIQEKLPIKIIILNNSYLGMVRQWQELFFNKRYSFTHLENPDFIKIAEGYSIKAERVTKKASLDKALDNLIEAKMPYLLEIVVDPEENVFPMIPNGASVEEMILG